MKNSPEITRNKNKNTYDTSTPMARELLGDKNKKAGASIKLPNRNIKLSRKVISSDKIDSLTAVWRGNERIQSLLNSDSLSDILPSIKESNQLVPAFGREVDGKIEIADGSRRRMAAIIANKEFIVDIGDFTDEEMKYLSDTGNQYNAPSAYEKGQKYKSEMEEMKVTSIREYALLKGIDRNIISRCLKTATLPIEVISLLHSPNELSAKAGYNLSRLILDEDGELTEQALESLISLQDKQEKLSAEALIKALTLTNAKKVEKQKHKISEHVNIEYFSDGKVKVIINREIPKNKKEELEELLATI